MKRALRIAGSAALLGVLAWRIEIGQVARALAGVHWEWCLAALACYVLAQVVSSVRWQWLARPLGFERPLSAYVGFYFVGNFFNLILPTSVGGDVARAWYLGRGSGRGTGALLSVLADRLNGLYVLVGLACVAALVEELPGWVRGWVVFAGVAGLFGLGLLLLARRWQPPAGRRRWRDLATALELYVRSPRLLAATTFLSMMVQVLNVVLLWFLALALGLGADVSLAYCFVLMPLVTLLTLVPISVNGMGVREGGTVVLLAPLGVAAEKAITLSLLWFSVFLAAGLAGGVWYLFGRLPRCEVRSDAEPVGGDPDQGREGQPKAAA